MSLKILITCTVLLIFFYGCKKDETLTDFYGRFKGQVKKETLKEGIIKIEPYEMIIDILRGDTANKMKLVFENVTTPGAVLSKNKFKLNAIHITPFLLVHADGEIIGDKLHLEYMEIPTATTKITYSGSLSRY